MFSCKEVKHGKITLFESGIKVRLSDYRLCIRIIVIKLYSESFLTAKVDTLY